MPALQRYEIDLVVFLVDAITYSNTSTIEPHFSHAAPYSPCLIPQAFSPASLRYSLHLEQNPLILSRILVSASDLLHTVNVNRPVSAAFGNSSEIVLNLC